MFTQTGDGFCPKPKIFIYIPLRSCSSCLRCLRLLPRLLVPYNFHSIACFRRQFVCRMCPIQLRYPNDIHLSTFAYNLIQSNFLFLIITLSHTRVHSKLKPLTNSRNCGLTLILIVKSAATPHLALPISQSTVVLQTLTVAHL